MFANRKDAAIKLAHTLEKYKDQDVVVLGIPRGGAEIAYYVALHLHAMCSLIITRKLAYVENPEAAFGAIAEDGSLYLIEEASDSVSEEDINSAVEKERREIQRRIKLLRKGRALPDLTGKTVILVDDGIATGATLFAAISMCKKKHVGKLIVAAPISSQHMENELRKVADEVVILEKPFFFHAVGQGYRNFNNLTDEETIAFVDAWEQKVRASPMNH